MKSNRFVFLDGIRGIASIFVLTRHTNSFWNVDIYHCYLAVDLFFILSGYVIAHAYDRKLATKAVSTSKFIIIRAIRLYPVFLLSLILSVIAAFSTDSILLPKNYYDVLTISAMISLTALFIPSHFNVEKELFPINGPYWSLFYEVTANIIYSIIRPILNNLTLLTIVIISGILLCIVSYTHQNLDAGFFFSQKSFVAGFTRSIFGIFTGLLLHRHHIFLGNTLLKNISPWVSFFIIIITLSIPSIPNINWLIDIIIVCFIYPFCVIIASNNISTKFEWALLALGSASYPIYVLHKPLGALVSNILEGNEKLYSPISGILLSALLISISILIEKYYDIPLRRKINSLIFSPPPKNTPQPETNQSHRQ